MNKEPEDSFIAFLIVDVIAAKNRHEKDTENQSARRDLIRCIFAAIEGTIWSFREKVSDAAFETFGLTDDETQALSEVQYHVSEQGKVTSQPRYISLTATFRLAVRIAERISETTNVDFSSADWDAFRRAIAVRNRITHPKSLNDLHISDEDTRQSLETLYWLLETQNAVLSSTIEARKRYLGLFQDVFEKLKAGDPETTALYEKLRSIKSH